MCNIKDLLKEVNNPRLQRNNHLWNEILPIQNGYSKFVNINESYSMKIGTLGVIHISADAVISVIENPI